MELYVLIHDAKRYVGHGSVREVGMAIAGGVAQLWYQGISNQWCIIVN